MVRVCVKMKESQSGSDLQLNGVTCPPKMYKKDEKYMLGEELAKALIGMGAAEYAKADKAVPDKKASKGAPENKSRR